jgi:hypothetical protein
LNPIAYLENLANIDVIDSLLVVKLLAKNENTQALKKINGGAGLKSKASGVKK